MKALILAAGFGTRLKPYTEITPKPLFQINGRPLLDITIHRLIQAGCTGVIINTHHLHKEIESFIAKKDYSVLVETCYEPEILDTGGAIKNVSDFWDDAPFIVVNSDIVTDIDFRKVYDFHMKHHHPVTLVLHDYEEFNKVATDANDFVAGFHLKQSHQLTELAFTGIQVMDPFVLSLIPENTFTSSIDLYRELISKGPNVKAYIEKNCYWIDIGTPDKFSTACRNNMAPEAFKIAFGFDLTTQPSASKLKGDGSDRKWYRIEAKGKSLILGDHGISNGSGTTEVQAFIDIGKHLYKNNIPVPEIFLADSFSGHVYLEDLGDTDLKTIVSKTKSGDEVLSQYKKVLKILAELSRTGGKDFDIRWTYQSTHYNRELILRNECHYFINAFINRVQGMNINASDLDEDFLNLANNALEYSYEGFMHRDFQSANIMVNKGLCYCIDFQGGRLGPVQYDLASLLIDPYVCLSTDIQSELVGFFVNHYSEITTVDRHSFLESYKYLKITRNLQMLGAFGFLSRIKGKAYFEKYIPPAIKTLKKNIKETDDKQFTKLKKIIDKI